MSSIQILKFKKKNILRNIVVCFSVKFLNIFHNEQINDPLAY